MAVLTPEGAGLATWTFPAAKAIERETVRCEHCGRHWYSRGTDGTRDLGGHCRICWSSICTPCADRGGCTPLLRRIEKMEARDRERRRFFEGLGI